MGAEVESTPQGFVLFLKWGLLSLGDLCPDYSPASLGSSQLWGPGGTMSWNRAGVILDRAYVTDCWILQVGVMTLTDSQEWA